jgi:hypothetical protein
LLAKLDLLQLPNEPWSQHKRDEEGRHGRIDNAKT